MGLLVVNFIYISLTGKIWPMIPIFLQLLNLGLVDLIDDPPHRLLAPPTTFSVAQQMAINAVSVKEEGHLAHTVVPFFLYPPYSQQWKGMVIISLS